MIDEGLLLKKLRSLSCLSPLTNTSRHAQYSISKQTYNDRGIRNIRKFLREEEEVMLKANQREEPQTLRKQEAKANRYDQNELKELEFHLRTEQSQQALEAPAIERVITESNAQSISARRRESFRKKLDKLKGPKMNRLLERKDTTFLVKLPQLMRLHSMSVSGKNSLNKEIASPQRLKKRLTMGDPINKSSAFERPRISLRDEQLKKALTRLMAVTDCAGANNQIFIPQRVIFDKIMQRYGLQSLYQSKGSEHNPEEEVFPIQLPFCEFVSLKDSRNSIDRIFNMPLKVAQRIAFKIYDRNGNGLIDEKDIIELFSIAEGSTAMQKDLEVIVKNYKLSSNRSSEISLESPLHVNIGLGERFSLKKADESQKPKEKSSRFHKERFFTFLQTKKNFYHKNQTAKGSIILTWEGFQRAFQSKLPNIYFDLLDYLFECESEKLHSNSCNKPTGAKESDYDIGKGINNRNHLYAGRESFSSKDSGTKARRFKSQRSVDVKSETSGNMQSEVPEQREISNEKINLMIRHAREIDELQPVVDW